MDEKGFHVYKNVHVFPELSYKNIRSRNFGVIFRELKKNGNPKDIYLTVQAPGYPFYIPQDIFPKGDKGSKNNNIAFDENLLRTETEINLDWRKIQKDCTISSRNFYATPNQRLFKMIHSEEKILSKYKKNESEYIFSNLRDVPHMETLHVENCFWGSNRKKMEPMGFLEKVLKNPFLKILSISNVFFGEKTRNRFFKALSENRTLESLETSITNDLFSSCNMGCNSISESDIGMHSCDRDYFCDRNFSKALLKNETLKELGISDSNIFLLFSRRSPFLKILASKRTSLRYLCLWEKGITKPESQEEYMDGIRRVFAILERNESLRKMKMHLFFHVKTDDDFLMKEKIKVLTRLFVRCLTKNHSLYSFQLSGHMFLRSSLGYSESLERIAWIEMMVYRFNPLLFFKHPQAINNSSQEKREQKCRACASFFSFSDSFFLDFQMADHDQEIFQRVRFFLI